MDKARLLLVPTFNRPAYGEHTDSQATLQASAASAAAPQSANGRRARRKDAGHSGAAASGSVAPTVIDLSCPGLAITDGAAAARTAARASLQPLRQHTPGAARADAAAGQAAGPSVPGAGSCVWQTLGRLSV